MLYDLKVVGPVTQEESTEDRRVTDQQIKPSARSDYGQLLVVKPFQQRANQVPHWIKVTYCRPMTTGTF